MADAAVLLFCLVVIATVCSKLFLARGSTSPGLRYLIACGLCLGTGMALLAPATMATLGGIHGTHLDQGSHASERLALLAGDVLKMAAVGLFVGMARSLQPPGRSHTLARWHAAVTAVALTAQPVLFTVARPYVSDDGVRTHGTATLVIAAYDTVFTTYCTWCLAAFTVLVAGHARHLGKGLLRTGLRLVTASAVVGMAWTAWSVDDIVSVLTTGAQDTCEDIPSAVLGAACITLAACGTTISAWGSRLGAPARWLRAYRGYRAIGPLWSALQAAVPDIVLPLSVGRTRYALPRDAEFALLRRVIEVRDAHLALQPYFHPKAAEWASSAACSRGLGGGPRLAATVEAATLAAALLAAEAGRRYPQAQLSGGPAPHGLQPSVEAETAWLVQVTHAFTRCQAVDQVRRRVRDELRHPSAATGEEQA